jgi:predicted Zn-dependent protease
LVCAAFAVRTYARNFDWRDEPSLWASAVKAAPESYMTHLGAALSEMASGAPKSETVDREMNRSLSILDPLPDRRSIPMPYANAGFWRRARGDMAPRGSGGAWYRDALAVLLRAKRVDLAQSEEVRRRNGLRGMALPYYSSSPDLYLDLGRVYLRLSDPRQAVEALEYGRLLSPQPGFSEELANAYRAEGQVGKAAVALHEGLFLTPAYQPFVSQLVGLYREIDGDGCAVATVGKRVGLSRTCPLVRNNACEAARSVVDLYSRTGRLAAAGELRGAAARDWACSDGLLP